MCASRGKDAPKPEMANAPRGAASQRAGVSGGDAGKEAAAGPGSVPTGVRSWGFLGSAGSLHKVVLEATPRSSKW